MKRAEIVQAVVTLGLAVVIAVVSYRHCSVPGDEVGRLSVPGRLELRAQAGDTLRFTVDTEVLFAGYHEDDMPRGCRMELVLSAGGKELGRSACDPYRLSENASAASSSWRNPQDGLVRLRLKESRSGCLFKVHEAGAVTLVATTNLGRCVPRFVSATAHVYRETAPR
jgi:hypothetical protein